MHFILFDTIQFYIYFYCLSASGEYGQMEHMKPVITDKVPTNINTTKHCVYLQYCIWITDYADVIMIEMASQITSLAIVYSIVYSDADQRKHQSSASLAFVRRIHRGPVNSPHKWPVTWKMFPFDDVIMWLGCCSFSHDFIFSKHKTGLLNNDITVFVYCMLPTNPLFIVLNVILHHEKIIVCKTNTTINAVSIMSVVITRYVMKHILMIMDK